MMATPQFGFAAPDTVYQPRPSVYAVITDNFGRLLVIFKRDVFFLPGGGIDEGESETAALVRECLEETGYEIARGELIGRANQYCYAPAQREFVNKLGSFYRAALNPTPRRPVLEAHEVRWVTSAEFETCPAHESHLWAVEQVLPAIR